jgi:hypothetical protein
MSKHVFESRTREFVSHYACARYCCDVISNQRKSNDQLKLIHVYLRNDISYEITYIISYIDPLHSLSYAINIVMTLIFFFFFFIFITSSYEKSTQVQG